MKQSMEPKIIFITLIILVDSKKFDSLQLKYLKINKKITKIQNQHHPNAFYLQKYIYLELLDI